MLSFSFLQELHKIIFCCRSFAEGATNVVELSRLAKINAEILSTKALFEMVSLGLWTLIEGYRTAGFTKHYTGSYRFKLINYFHIDGFWH